MVKDKKYNKKCQAWLDFAPSLEYIYQDINPKLIKELTSFNDDDAKILLLAYIYNLLKGARYIPVKSMRMGLASYCVQRGWDEKRVCQHCGISRRSYYRIKKELKK